MKVKIAKWGNSLALRLPKKLAEEAGLRPDAEVDVTVEDGDIRMKRVRRRPRYTLEDMIAGMKPGTEPTPSVEWGPDVGAEILPDDDWSDIAPTDERSKR